METKPAISKPEKQQGMTIPQTTIALNSPAELAAFATSLKQFIVDRKLFTKIVDKNYVNVEGWQFAGAVLGIMPFLKTCEKLVDREGEVAYRAEVLLKNLTGDVIGSSMAVCSNKESKKRSFDEYAIASMAQTRAIGKAYRSSFGWLMKMAGYEATPAEEMDEKTIKVGGRELPTPDKVEAVPFKATPTKEPVASKIMEEVGGSNGRA